MNYTKVNNMNKETKSIGQKRNRNRIIAIANKWYDPINKCIIRRMKDPQKLIEYADRIARLYFIPNSSGRGEYCGEYIYRKNVWGENNNDEGYYAITIDEYTGDRSSQFNNEIIRKRGKFWYYILRNV